MKVWNYLKCIPGWLLTPWNIIALMLFVVMFLIRTSQLQPVTVELDPSLTGAQEKGNIALEMKLYYSSLDAKRFVIETRNARLESDAMTTRASRTVNEWFSGPESKDSFSPFPSSLSGLDVQKPVVFARKDTVFVSVPKVWSSIQLGSNGELLLYCGLANSLLDLKDVKNVQFLEAGKRVETIGGHLSTLQPFTLKECRGG
jgi:Sporulation and spore germination